MAATLIDVTGTVRAAGKAGHSDSDRTLLDASMQRSFAKAFTFSFFALSAAIIFVTFGAALRDVFSGGEITQIILRIVNANIIAMAVFELAMVISTEYGEDEEPRDVLVMLRRTLPRFIGTVCVALALEGLILVIKSAQLDLGGSMYYPVAIIAGAALLLMSLGVFLKLAPEYAGPPQIDCVR